MKQVRAGATLPEPATPGAAGLDLRACIDAPVTLLPGARAIIPTGLAMALPSAEYVALLFGRSGLGINHGVTLSNAVGVIDSDYRGEVAVGLTNHGTEPYTVSSGDRIAQLVVIPVCAVTAAWAEALPETARGAGGFGSTGKR